MLPQATKRKFGLRRLRQNAISCVILLWHFVAVIVTVIIGIVWFAIRPAERRPLVKFLLTMIVLLVLLIVQLMIMMRWRQESYPASMATGSTAGVIIFFALRKSVFDRLH